MSIWHVESLENGGDEGHLAKTDAVIIAVDLDAEELPCWTEVCHLVFFRELPLDLNRCFGGRLRTCIHHGDVINVQKDENAIAEDMEVRIGVWLCEPEGEEEGVDIVVPEARCLLQTVESFPESHNDRLCVRVFVLM